MTSGRTLSYNKIDHDATDDKRNDEMTKSSSSEYSGRFEKSILINLMVNGMFDFSR